MSLYVTAKPQPYQRFAAELYARIRRHSSVFDEQNVETGLIVGLVGRMVQVEYDARAYQGVAGEFNAIGFKSILDRQQRFHVGIRYTAIHFITTERSPTHTAVFSQVGSTPTQKRSGRFNLTNAYQMLSL